MRPIHLFKQVVFKTITPFRFFLWGLILAVFMPVHSNAQRHPWVKYEYNPIIKGTLGDWKEGVYYPAVIYDDGLYKMWWGSGSYDIGYGESSDGIHWDLEEEPVIPQGTSGDWDFYRVPGTVLHMNGTYKMWYMGYITSPYLSIGYAESADGIEWNVFEDPVFEKGEPGSWDKTLVGFPQVIYDETDSLYHMYYTGGPGYGTGMILSEIGHATSTDGINWERGTKVISRGNPGTFSDAWVKSHGLVFHNDTLHMFYEAYDNQGPGFWDGRWQIGYAWSTDYVTWVTDTVDLGVGEPGEWDQHAVSTPTVLVKDDTMRMWYTGFRNDGSPWKIGYASYPHPTISGLVNRSPLLSDALSISPNPFTGLIRISFELPKRSMVQLEVYNSSGQLISTLVNEIRQQGAHEVSLEGTQLPPGVYFCALKTSEGVQMEKMVKQ